MDALTGYLYWQHDDNTLQWRREMGDRLMDALTGYLYWQHGDNTLQCTGRAGVFNPDRGVG